MRLRDAREVREFAQPRGGWKASASADWSWKASALQHSHSLTKGFAVTKTLVVRQSIPRHKTLTKLRITARLVVVTNPDIEPGPTRRTTTEGQNFVKK